MATSIAVEGVGWLRRKKMLFYIQKVLEIASEKMRICCEEEEFMLNAVKDIHPLTAFKRDSAGMMRRMKKTGRPLILTVNGKAEVVVLDAEAYSEIAEHLDTVAHIRQGLAEAKRGLGRPVDEVFDDLAGGERA